MKVYCLRTGDFYGPHYAERLERGLRRNTCYDFDFVCITESDFPRCWGKMMFFDPPERIIYLDLDVVITGNVDFLFQYDGAFSIWTETIGLKGPQENILRGKTLWSGAYNTSIMAIGQGFGKEIKKAFLAEPQRIMQQFNSDQDFVSFWLYPLADTWSCFDRIKSYKFNQLQNEPGPETRIVVFHGEPKMDVIKSGWVPELWQ